MSARTKFYLDPQDGKWKGVCAGIADYTGVEVLWVRLGVAAMTVIAQQWWIVLAYFIIAWVAEAKPNGLYDTPEDAKFWQGMRSNPKRSTAEVRSKFRDIDRRLADIELHYTSRNTRLAEEIDSLR
ncbi:envelope stress response membrane protein PspC [Sphingomonadaceae bacterium OTU29MARTA1]|uniref:envelope stress response membrane protein PspC n=1 Tax=Sphingomonas sp. Leaf37 TaxID=2876552 RepID=UPI001E44DB04|nr:envelope stress response membrane protein PspC [Sphingomonas sp. Leaf37]USU06057.1 envelope stress response membrane protein PspC [Sphingomonadaceae bacterium OTU29LAMAA1]USU09541.1 envelope stress response membrane protein PspC [Sphingomonadaceae bacterium OTU29MARTA1]USU12975.1 envelope stress response membrane protein PspC [Sphingomonadaceae bacterium OTU29THOMA1]